MAAGSRPRHVRDYTARWQSLQEATSRWTIRRCPTRTRSTARTASTAPNGAPGSSTGNAPSTRAYASGSCSGSSSSRASSRAHDLEPDAVALRAVAGSERPEGRARERARRALLPRVAAAHRARRAASPAPSPRSRTRRSGTRPLAGVPASEELARTRRRRRRMSSPDLAPDPSAFDCQPAVDIPYGEPCKRLISSRPSRPARSPIRTKRVYPRPTGLLPGLGRAADLAVAGSC